MVRSHSNQLHHDVPESNDSRHRNANRPLQNKSTPHHRKSPWQHSSSSWPSQSERKGSDNGSSRGHVRIDNQESGNHSARNCRRDYGSSANSNRTANKWPKWSRNKPKKRRRGRVGPPPLSGGNIAPVVDRGNRQPIASMRMRMDDYIAPRAGRLLPLAKGNDIRHVVARARREASTRTKDTFWTKKLLDAESSHPSRWTHTGFKEMYKEELGYSEMVRERSLRHSPGRSRTVREDFLSKKSLSKSPGKQRSSVDRSRTASAKPKSNSRFKTGKSLDSKFSRSRSRSKSFRSRRRTRQQIPTGKARQNATRKENSEEERSGKRGSWRSLSRSISTVSSRFDSDSDSRSYSSYTSSHSSSETSSSFSSSSTSSSRSYRKRRRSYSRSWATSRSKSRSPSPTRLPPPKIKSASLSKAVHVQSVHMKKEISKKPLTKTVSNIDEATSLFNPSASTSDITTLKSKTKAPKHLPSVPHMPGRPHILRHSKMLPPNSAIASPPLSELYETQIHPEKGSSSAFVETVDKFQYKSDIRRGADTTLKAAHAFVNVASQQLEANASNLVAATRSEGEQSNSDSSSDDDDIPLKMTLSERFGKLAQLSSQRQEYEGVRMKIVREGGQDKKVYLEGESRSPSPLRSRNSNVAHERWLREHKAEYDEYEERYGEFREWDPHRDLPRELPPNWDDVNVRYQYYKESGYFGERSITMEDYLKWEEWWYRYRDWLEKYGGVQEDNLKYRGPYGGYVDVPRGAGRDRWIRRENHREKDDHRRIRY